MKNILSFLLSVVIAFFSIFMSFAHSGRTDASGGHRDNKNKSGLGYYHYHCGGYPAHLHPNGVCPYKTGSTTTKSNSSINNSTATKSNSNSTTTTTKASSGTPSKQNQKVVVTVEKTAIYAKASITSDKLATAKRGYTFTPTSSTKSFWKFEFKKKDDSTIYTGYILKSDAQ